ncbi:DUF3489 domain-containing protein [Tsuneonella rigui]|uniref:DUF3489 domain-containing protein n=1 Tax=Tsuneonella rigui TaxID=1708790 RepID=UPI000F7EA6DD|nr:DUF3489 domain-containing protein [Tsuneonella rigui]
MTSIKTQAAAAKRPRRLAREPRPQQSAGAGNYASGNAPDEQISPTKAPKVESKNEAVLAMLKRPDGATRDQMVEATGWLPHTTRAVLTGFKKKGYSITSEKVGGVRVYRVANGAASQ